MSQFPNLRFSILAHAAPAILFGQPVDTATSSTSRTQTFHTTNATEEVNNYRTGLTAGAGATSITGPNQQLSSRTLTGTPGAPPATPAPPSLWPTLSGGAAAGLTALTKRLRKQ